MKRRTTEEWTDLLRSLSVEAEQDEEYFVGGILKLMPITMELGFTLAFMYALTPVINSIDAVLDAAVAAGKEQLNNEAWPDNLEDKV